MYVFLGWIYPHIAQKLYTSPQNARAGAHTHTRTHTQHHNQNQAAKRSSLALAKKSRAKATNQSTKTAQKNTARGYRRLSHPAHPRAEPQGTRARMCGGVLGQGVTVVIAVPAPAAVSVPGSRFAAGGCGSPARRPSLVAGFPCRGSPRAS